MKGPVVVDNSVSTAWVVPDERSKSAREILVQVKTLGIIVPLLWKIESANTLLVCERRGRLTAIERQDAIARYNSLNIEIDPETLTHIWGKTLDLARQYNLTVYDATYLELALRRHLPLATYDKELGQAAATAGIALL